LANIEKKTKPLARPAMIGERRINAAASIAPMAPRMLLK